MSRLSTGFETDGNWRFTRSAANSRSHNQKKNPKLTEAYHKRAQVRQKLQDFEEAIAPRSTEGLLGQDFLAHYNVRILENEVELHR